MRGIRLIPIALAIAAFLVPAAFPRDAGARRANDIKYGDVERILKHRPEATPADLAAAGSDIDSVLADMASTRKLDAELRRRAVRALGGYPIQRTRAVLTTLITTPDETTDVRCVAMEAMARAFGANVLPDLKPYLDDTDPRIRAGAARALGQARGAKTRQLLEYALEHEDVLEVRMAIDEALSRLR